MQTTTDCKGHEGEAARNLIAAAPDDLGGAVISTDALHLQNETMELASEHNAHMLIGLKGNHGKMLETVQEKYEHYDACNEQMPSHFMRDKGHGRLETRHARICEFSSPEHPLIQSAIQIQRNRQDIRRGHLIGEPSEETSFYVATFPRDAFSPEKVNHLTRNHWAVENKLHHVKDRTMQEDRYRAKDAVAANLGLIRSTIVALKGRFKNRGGILSKSLRGSAAKALEAIRKPLANL